MTQGRSKEETTQKSGSNEGHLSGEPSKEPDAPSTHREDAVLRENIERVQSRIRRACRIAGRNPEDVHLLAVTKTAPPRLIQSLSRLGLSEFGENKAQIALPKLEALSGCLPSSVRWHFIGHLQSNKASRIARAFSVIHSVDSLSLARRISRDVEKVNEGERPRIIDVFLQVNVAEETQKSGLSLSELETVAEEVANLRGVRLVGFMTMAPLATDAEGARPVFSKMRDVASDLRRSGRVPGECRELSMGMTDDLEVAIEEGATWIRVGSALFDGLELT